MKSIIRLSKSGKFRYKHELKTSVKKIQKEEEDNTRRSSQAFLSINKSCRNLAAILAQILFK